MILILMSIRHSIAQKTNEYILFRNKSASVVCTIHRSNQLGLPKDIYDIKAVFVIRHLNKVENITIDLGESYSDELVLGVYSFTDEKKKQMFISTNLGRRSTYIFDYVNGEIISIYKRTNGRILVKPIAGKMKIFNIKEYWPKNQWDDKDFSGSYSVDEKNGIKSRQLRWSGSGFKVVN